MTAVFCSRAQASLRVRLKCDGVGKTQCSSLLGM
jgi:hypothetical protein